MSPKVALTERQANQNMTRHDITPPSEKWRKSIVAWQENCVMYCSFLLRHSFKILFYKEENRNNNLFFKCTSHTQTQFSTATNQNQDQLINQLASYLIVLINPRRFYMSVINRQQHVEAFQILHILCKSERFCPPPLWIERRLPPHLLSIILLCLLLLLGLFLLKLFHLIHPKVLHGFLWPGGASSGAAELTCNGLRMFPSDTSVYSRPVGRSIRLPTGLCVWMHHGIYGGGTWARCQLVRHNETFFDRCDLNCRLQTV